MNKEKIIELKNKGLTQTKIAEIFGVSRQRISQIILGNPVYLSKERLAEKEKRIIEYKKKIENYFISNYSNFIDIIGENSISQLTGMGVCSRDRIRELIRIRDNHTCQICGKTWIKGQRRFDVHHNDESLDGKTAVLSVNECDRKNVSKMITLCHKCHLNLEMTRNKMRIGRLRSQVIVSA